MRKAWISLFAVIIGLATSMPVAAQSARIETIAAIINEEAISQSEVNDRLKLIIASSGMPDNADIREKLRPQVINALIEEKLKLQEAERLGLSVSPEEIDSGFATLAGQNNMPPEKFRALLAREKVNVGTLEDQIRAQIAWSRVIQTKLRPEISVADNEVDSMLARLRVSEGKTEYLVSEIFLPVEKPGAEHDVKRLADRLTTELLEGRVPFQRLAAQFSQAAGASKGGDLGWVQEGQLPDPLDQALAGMSEGDLSEPVRSLAGYHILLLRQKRAITANTLPSREQITQQIGLERLDRKQRRYLMDLKTRAFIERRV